MKYPVFFGVVVVGGGHAGVEAALASARMGVKTCLVTQSIDTIGQMSCNPAIGGIGKGHLVKEIDALGGAMGKAADEAGIQFRVLNASKGPAVRATRAQTDRVLYKAAIRRICEQQANLTLFQHSIDELIIHDGAVRGVKTQLGVEIEGDNVVLTVGTFLGGCIHVGDVRYGAGRAGEPPSNALSQQLRSLPFPVGRLKTGTPPRLDGRTVNWDVLEKQPGTTPRPVFSFLNTRDVHPKQVPCHITYTNERTHEIIRADLHRSAMYSGNIEGTGPRYCPSIEDKIVRFADKERHQIFVEPEGLSTYELYPNGMSTSLPSDTQLKFIRSISGFECVDITRFGYAIEYDYFEPTCLQPSLETKLLKGLYFAGQINGTTGYEEAAAQGLLAGINAGLAALNKSPWVPGRDEAYIGVMVDDLVTKGTLEPYRMFTSRAEYRLLLREDNADERLTPIGHRLGVVDKERWDAFSYKQDSIKVLSDYLQQNRVKVGSEMADRISAAFSISIKQDISFSELLKRPEITLSQLQRLGAFPSVDFTLYEMEVETGFKYEGYIARQKKEIEKSRKHKKVKLPAGFVFNKVPGLSSEMIEKLEKVRPLTIGQAERIPGMTPAAISLLLVYTKKHTSALNN